MPNFTWIPIYKKIAEKLIEFRLERQSLISLLTDMSKNGLKIISLQDKNEYEQFTKAKATTFGGGYS